MRVNRPCVFAVSATISMLAVPLCAQAPKAGLWDVTSTQTWQQSPFPQGMTPPGSDSHSKPVCVTQQQIDKYNGIVPQQQSHGCQITNVSKKSDGMTAEIDCSGMMTGKGTVEAIWSDSEHTRTKVHFVGTMHMGPNSKPVEWTNESAGVFKSSDCGSVKPLGTPQ